MPLFNFDEEAVEEVDVPTNMMSHLSIGSSITTRDRRRSSLTKFHVNTPPNLHHMALTPLSNDLRKLDDFEPLKVLGRGAYGKVLLVKDRLTDKLYAMKQLQKAEVLVMNQPEKQIERTMAEREILSKLDHPNIVKLFYSFHDHQKLYLVLQYIPGGELFYHLKEQGTLDEDVVAFYAGEIAMALRFLHKKGIVYRDLKPENCLVDSRGHLVLTDFGLSKVSDEGDSLHSIIGTPEYCAPEILQGEAYDQRCDWYSLGCLIYDMLIGKPPYTGDNHKVILNKINKDKAPRIPSYLSEGMKDLLGALLKKDVTKRWDVDKYWDMSEPKTGKKKAGQAKTSAFTEHFVFRKLAWKTLSEELGPIIPIITDEALAENFDVEFTDMKLSMDGVAIEGQPLSGSVSDHFKGFSYVASSSYLERYF